MNLSNEFVAGLLTLFITLIMNLLIKFVELKKPKEELDKTAIEAADLSFDMLKEALVVIGDRNRILESERDARATRIAELEHQVKDLTAQLEIALKEIKELKGE